MYRNCCKLLPRKSVCALLRDIVIVTTSDRRHGPCIRSHSALSHDHRRHITGTVDQGSLGILAEGAERGIVVEDGRIAELVPAGGVPQAPAAVFDAGAHVVLPGLINTHHHFYQTLTRAVPAAIDRELFGWLQALYPIWARLTPEALELAVTLAMAELLLSGCTTTTDHHYVFPAGLEQAIDIEVAAAQRLGMRVVLTRGSMNRSHRDGGLPPEAVVQDEDTILADC